MEDIKVATTIVEAEVYRSGCTIVRRGTVALPAGTSHLVVEDLPRDLDEGSISLRMPAGVTQSQVRVVREGLFYGGAIVSPTEELNKQIKELDRRIENLELELEAWKDLARKMSGPAAIDFLERLPAKLDELSSTHARLTEERNKLSRERDKRHAQLLRPRLEVEVSVAEAGNLPLELRFRCASAGWTPSYDVLVEELNEPLRLRMRGTVWQQTGDDWKDITLRLSTGTATVAGDLPRFHPRYLSKAVPHPAALPKASMSSARFGAFGSTRDMPMAAIAAEDAFADFDSLEETLPPEATVQEQATATTYELNGAQSLASDREGQTFVVNTRTLAATYHLYTYPRVDDAAYLVAHLDEEPAPEVLEQPLSVYLDGSYAGSISIGRTTDDEGYELPLGKDERVRVRRHEDVHRSKRLLGGKVVVEHTSTIIVESRKDLPMSLVVIEQVPVSQDKEIEVTVRETSGASHDVDRGELRWERTLEAGGRLTLTAGYEVSHARGVQVSDGMHHVSGTPGVGTRFCHRCGSPVPEHMSFCPTCGSRL